MNQQAAAPLSKPVQWLIVLAVVAGLYGVWLLVGPKTRPCTVRESHQTSDICVVTGTVAAYDKTQKDLNPLTLGTTTLDVVMLTDSTGTLDVYFDPAKLSLSPGSTLTVKGRRIEQRGGGGASAAKRFVAETVE